MIGRFSLGLLLLLFGAVVLRADTSAPAGDWDKVSVAPMKTSIYVGTVTLTTGVFRRDGDKFESTYEAKVWPWFFWSETGRITITLPAADLAKLSRGERVEFTGTAANQRGKPRTVTGRADNTNGAAGRIKVRIGADGTELIFNGTYRFDNAVK
jgi:hypothetical protein